MGTSQAPEELPTEGETVSPAESRSGSSQAEGEPSEAQSKVEGSSPTSEEPTPDNGAPAALFLSSSSSFSSSSIEESSRRTISSRRRSSSCSCCINRSSRAKASSRSRRATRSLRRMSLSRESTFFQSPSVTTRSHLEFRSRHSEHRPEDKSTRQTRELRLQFEQGVGITWEDAET